MINNDSAIARFFHAYAHASCGNDVSAMVSRFADTFMTAGPQGTQCVRSSDFAQALPKRKALFDQLGCQPASLVALEETPLDDRYILARTRWRFAFVRSDAETLEIFVDSTFLIDTGSEDFKIVLYLAHQEIMQILKDHRILKD